MNFCTITSIYEDKKTLLNVYNEAIRAYTIIHSHHNNEAQTAS